MTEWVSIGRVGRPHGREGAFVVDDASEAPERFAAGATVYVEREPARVVESKRAGGRLVVRLDREIARGRTLELRTSELPVADEGAYYVFTLLGLVVEEEGGGILGIVDDVEPGVANDVLRLDTGLALPFVDECIRSVELEAGRIVVAPGFADAG